MAFICALVLMYGASALFVATHTVVTHFGRMSRYTLEDMRSNLSRRRPLVAHLDVMIQVMRRLESQSLWEELADARSRFRTCADQCDDSARRYWALAGVLDGYEEKRTHIAIAGYVGAPVLYLMGFVLIVLS